MIDTSAFKTTIIDLAVTGQLSEQFHADDSVDDITAALPPLSNKRSKLLGQSFENGKQAALPDHWRWICLGEISSYGDTPQKAYFDDVSGDTWILDLEDIRSGGQIIKKTRVHGKKFIGDKTVFSEGQVLYSKLRPYLKKVLVADEDGISTPELISFDTYGGMIPQYVVYCLLSSFTDRAIEKRSYGIKMPRIDAAFMVNLPIPVPPVSEQQFIVDRVQEAFSQIDTIDSLQAQYADNLTVLKGKLIDAAIQGKLTEQLPEDGTTEELLRVLTAKKKEIESSGVLKGRKKKKIKHIENTELPFTIPNTWQWVRLDSVAEIYGRIGFRGYTKSDIVEKGNGAVSLSPSNITKDGKIVFDNCTYISWEKYEESPEIMVNEEDIILVKTGSSYGKCTVVKALPEKATINPQLAVLKYVLCNRYYLHIVLNSSMAHKQYEEFVVGAATPTFSQEDLANFLLPLPPLSEQERIVQKINELMPIFEK